MINTLFSFLLFLTAIPVGFLIAFLARDELVAGRRWFRGLVLAGILGAGWAFLIGKGAIVWTLLYLAVLAFIAYCKGFDGKWTKMKA